MKGVPVRCLVASHEDAESEERLTPAPERKTLKSGKVWTANSSILHKVVV